MKLFEIYNIDPRFAWFEPEVGPNSINGVRLAFIEPVGNRLDAQIQGARERQNPRQEEMFRLRKQNYTDSGQKFFTPDLGWWMSEEDFHAGKDSASGITKGNVFQKYPNLEIFSSRKEAITAAKKAKII